MKNQFIRKALKLLSLVYWVGLLFFVVYISFFDCTPGAFPVAQCGFSGILPGFIFSFLLAFPVYAGIFFLFLIIDWLSRGYEGVQQIHKNEQERNKYYRDIIFVLVVVLALGAFFLLV